MQSSLKINIMAGTLGGVGPSCVTISIRCGVLSLGHTKELQEVGGPSPGSLVGTFPFLGCICFESD